MEEAKEELGEGVKRGKNLDRVGVLKKIETATNQQAIRVALAT